MPKRRPSDDQDQLDLFDFTANAVSEPSEATQSCEPIEVIPAAMDDATLLAAFPWGRVGQVPALAAEIARRRPEGWQQAALSLWNRFVGFGDQMPFPEQRAVLVLTRETGAKRLLQDILARGWLPQGLNGDLVQAAAVCSLRLDTDRVRRVLRSPDADLRRAAVEIAIPSGMPLTEVHPLLSDRDRSVRHLAAIVLAETGNPEARLPLLRLLKLQPTRRGLEALAAYEDEDALVRLGQIARQHPEWGRVVRNLIEDFPHPKADAVLATVPERFPDRPD